MTRERKPKFDHPYQFRELYWPHGGQENHAAGHPFRFGVRVDRRSSWVSDDGWEHRPEYEP